MVLQSNRDGTECTCTCALGPRCLARRHPSCWCWAVTGRWGHTVRALKGGRGGGWRGCGAEGRTGSRVWDGAATPWQGPGPQSDVLVGGSGAVGAGGGGGGVHRVWDPARRSGRVRWHSRGACRARGAVARCGRCGRPPQCARRGAGAASRCVTDARVLARTLLGAGRGIL